MRTHYDVIVIGAGAVGCAVARELARFSLSACVLEKETDVGTETSGRNSAVVHAGFNNRPGSLMAKLCVEGCIGFEDVCQELDVPYEKTGKLVVAFDDEDVEVLHKLIAQGKKNGVKGLSYIGQEELHAREPQVSGIGALFSTETAIFDPFLYTVALAENAQTNGVSFYFNSEVTEVKKNASEWVVTTDTDTFSCTYMINCAGLYSDVIARMTGQTHYTIYPCRGEYLVLDKTAAKHVGMPVYPAPKFESGVLGVHLTPTTEGNVIVGPSAEYIEDKAENATTKPILDQLFAEANKLLPLLKKEYVIGSFNGIRPKLSPPQSSGFSDFVIRDEGEGLIQLIGIESPGITASLPIARMVAKMLRSTSVELLGRQLTERPDFNPLRKGVPRFRTLSQEEQNALIAEEPEYGEVFCRCEYITKREIRAAIENSLGVRSITGIKRRTRATMGRCNGGYCLPRIASLMVEEYQMKPEDICLRGTASYLFADFVK